MFFSGHHCPKDLKPLFFSTVEKAESCKHLEVLGVWSARQGMLTSLAQDFSQLSLPLL